MKKEIRQFFPVLTGLFLYFLNSCFTISQETGVRLTVLNSLERIAQDQSLYGDSRATVKAARNEVESFQVIVGALQKNIRVERVEISDLKGSRGVIGKENIVLYREEYVRVRRSTPRAQLPPGLYPDPLIPFVNPQTGLPIGPFDADGKKNGLSSGHELYGLPFDVWKGENQPVWVDIRVPGNAESGEYRGILTFDLVDMPLQAGEPTGKTMKTSLTVPVNLLVWNITLPDGPSMRNHFGSVREISRTFGADLTSDRYREIEQRYCRMMADHRINPPLPASLLPGVNEDGSLVVNPARHQSLKKFIEELHVTDFEIPKMPLNEMNKSNRDKALRYYRDYYRYLEGNGWEKKAYVYLFDEPNTREEYSAVKTQGDLIREAEPRLRCLVVEQPYKQDPAWPDIDPETDIWCPIFAAIERNSINSVISQGDEVWSYTALSQRAPEYHPQYSKVRTYDPSYWHIDNLLTSYRTPAWMNYQYKITGLLYWTTVQIYESKSGVMDPWFLPAFSMGSFQFNGGGYLIYPGIPCGIEGPVPSIRLKVLRDSMEDYEYLAILEKAGGRDAVLKFVDTVAPEWWSTTDNPEVILSAREKIAVEIERLGKQD